MATTVQNEEAPARLTSEQVWKKVAAQSFAVLGYVTPGGEPRASGVVYKPSGGASTWRLLPTVGRRGTSRPAGRSR
jgi:hypothetical protein